MIDNTKKPSEPSEPSELDGVKAEIDNALEGESMPSISNYNSVNPNPKTESRNDLAHKFQQIRLINTLMTESRSFDKMIEQENKQKLQQGKVNAETAQEFQGFFNKRLSTIRGSYSFLALQKLDRQMELLSQIEYEGYAVYDKALGAFGSINYHILKAIFAKDSETLSWLEGLIVGIGAFIMGGPAPDSDMVFDPESDDLKYPLNDNDNPSTKLFKDLFNIIYHYEDRIILNNIGDLSAPTLAANTIASILGIDEHSVRNHLGRIDETNSGPATYNLRENVYIKLKAGIKRSLNQPQLREVKDLMNARLNAYSVQKWGEISLTMELRSIFTAYADPIEIKGTGGAFSEATLAEALGRGNNYINKLKDKGTTPKEKTDKYFKLLTLIELTNDLTVSPYGENKEDKLENLNKIKKECKELIFKRMTDPTSSLISTEVDMKPLFDLTIKILTALTLATKPRNAMSDRQEVYSITDLSRIASKGGGRWVFYSKFKNGNTLPFTQGERIKKELRKSYFTSAQQQIDETITDIKNYHRKQESKYHQHFRNNLYILQIFELFSITLGVDVFKQNFIEDAEPTELSGKYKIDVIRHHPQEDKSIYTIFDMTQTQLELLVNLIPLTQSSHASISGFLRGNSDIENRKAVARFLHLYELIQKPYDSSKNYYDEFKKEFNTRTFENQKLWDKWDQDQIFEFTLRWDDQKDNPTESVFDEDVFFAKNYRNWYYETFAPNMEDYRQYLLQSASCEKPEFWNWFVNTYLRKDTYPA